MKIKFTRSLILFAVTIVCSLSFFAQTSNKNQAVEVPFDFYRNEIILQVKVSGKDSFNMLLDTGTDPSAIDLSTAKQIGLKLDSVGRKGTGGGRSANLTYATELPLVEIGNLKAKNVEALAIDLSKIRERLDKPIGGILGHSLLNGRIVQIDYPKRVVRFYQKSPFPKAANRTDNSRPTTLSFRYDDNILIDGVSVNGKKMTANFDTGSDAGFKLTPDAVSVLGLSDEVGKAEVSESVGYNGAVENRKGKLKNVTIGGISVDEPLVLFFGKGMGRDKEPWAINIGNAFLKDFVVTVDYRSKTVTLEKP